MARRKNVQPDQVVEQLTEEIIDNSSELSFEGDAHTAILSYEGYLCRQGLRWVDASVKPAQSRPLAVDYVTAYEVYTALAGAVSEIKIKSVLNKANVPTMAQGLPGVKKLQTFYQLHKAAEAISAAIAEGRAARAHQYYLISMVNDDGTDQGATVEQIDHLRRLVAGQSGLENMRFETRAERAARLDAAKTN
jgi:hypothetical protein